MSVAAVNGGGRRILPQELPRKEEGPPAIAFLVNPRYSLASLSQVRLHAGFI